MAILLMVLLIVFFVLIVLAVIKMNEQFQSLSAGFIDLATY